MATVTLLNVERFSPDRLIPALRRQVQYAGGSCSIRADGNRLRVEIAADDGLASCIAGGVADWYIQWRRSVGPSS